MSRGMLQRLAAVLLLLCLPVAAEGAETIPEQADPSEGTLVTVSVWQADGTWTPLQAGEGYRLTNAQGQTLVRTADGWSGNMPWKWASSPGSPGTVGVEHSDFYRLELDLQWTNGKTATVDFLRNETGYDWCVIQGTGIATVEFTLEELVITGQDMTYKAIFSQGDSAYGDVQVEGSGEDQVTFSRLQEDTIQVDTRSAPGAVRLGNYFETALNVQIEPGEIALAGTGTAEPELTVAAQPRSAPSLPVLAAGAGAPEVAAACALLWRRKRRAAGPACPGQEEEERLEPGEAGTRGEEKSP